MLLLLFKVDINSQVSELPAKSVSGLQLLIILMSFRIKQILLIYTKYQLNYANIRCCYYSFDVHLIFLLVFFVFNRACISVIFWQLYSLSSKVMCTKSMWRRDLSALSCVSEK